jgi:hypothetical protein
MMKALAAMRGPLSFTAVEFSKCQHQTVVDLVDLVGMESPGDRANTAIQAVPEPVFRVAKTTKGLLVRVAMTAARLVPVGMMIAPRSAVMMTVRLVRVVMMIAPGSAVMMTVRRVPVGMMIAPGSAVMMTVRLVRVVTMIAQFVGVVMMIAPVSVVMMTVRLVRVVTMIAQFVGVVMMTAHVSVVMMTVRRVLAGMSASRHVLVQLRSRRPTRFAIGVVVVA